MFFCVLVLQKEGFLHDSAIQDNFSLTNDRQTIRAVVPFPGKGSLEASRCSIRRTALTLDCARAAECVARRMLKDSPATRGLAAV